MNELLTQAFDFIRTSQLIPKKYESDWFIAGGFAACPELASDIDVWVNVGASNSLEGARLNLLRHLELNRFAMEPQDEDAETADYEGVGIQILKVAAVESWAGVMPPLPIHLMVTDAPVCGVFANFDISTHQIAVNCRGEIIRGEHWTPLEEEPVVLMDNVHTPDRLVKITQRYKHLRQEPRGEEIIQQ